MRSVVLFEMLRHFTALTTVTRKVGILYTVVSTLNIRPNCAKVSSTSVHSVFRRDMGDSQSGLPDTSNVARPGKVKLTDEEWKKRLTAKEYRVTRQCGTEAAYTGELLENKEKGVYVCSCCGAELFTSSAKYDSGCGWPAFSDVLKDKDMADLPAIDTLRDESVGMVRTEVRCGKCEAHLGHVFDDGPGPTGLRYCINSVSLKFKQENQKK